MSDEAVVVVVRSWLAARAHERDDGPGALLAREGRSRRFQHLDGIYGNSDQQQEKFVEGRNSWTAGRARVGRI
jgi:hypothetical protein